MTYYFFRYTRPPTKGVNTKRKAFACKVSVIIIFIADRCLQYGGVGRGWGGGGGMSGGGGCVGWGIHFDRVAVHLNASITPQYQMWF